MKTLAIRLEDDLHAQLSVLAQLEELTITDAIRQAIEGFIESKRHNPELTARAGAVLADIERDAEARREAIATLFKPGGPTVPKESGPAAAEGDETTGGKPSGRSSRTRGGGPANS
jgi:predicted transcriptional regulator